MPANPRLDQRDPFHPQYAKRREYQSKIITAKLRKELLNNRKPTLQEQIYIESAAVLILELKSLQTKFLKAKFTQPPKEFYSVLNSLRITLAQLPARTKSAKHTASGGESLDLGSIING